MLANTFSHGMIRNYVVGFGTLFNNIKINRRSSSGESASTIAVPLSYAPRQRYIERITEDYNLDKPVAMSLPRMSFELMQVQYSTERKLNTMQRYKRPTLTSNTKIDVVYSPVPYDFTFQLNIYISSIEDGTHIVEQILPYFTPEFTISLKGATDINIPMDLPIVLNAVNMEDSYEGGFDDRRIIIWTMDFTLKGNLFGPITQAGVINKTFVNMIPSMDVGRDKEQIVTRPSELPFSGIGTNIMPRGYSLFDSASSDYIFADYQSSFEDVLTTDAKRAIPYRIGNYPVADNVQPTIEIVESKSAEQSYHGTHGIRITASDEDGTQAAVELGGGQDSNRWTLKIPTGKKWVLSWWENTNGPHPTSSSPQLVRLSAANTAQAEAGEIYTAPNLYIDFDIYGTHSSFPYHTTPAGLVNTPIVPAVWQWVRHWVYFDFSGHNLMAKTTGGGIEGTTGHAYLVDDDVSDISDDDEGTGGHRTVGNNIYADEIDRLQMMWLWQTATDGHIIHFDAVQLEEVADGVRIPSEYKEPGLATTSRALSVDPSLIYADSDFGIAQDIFTIHQDPATYKIWEFRGPKHGTVAFGQSAGNTTVDGWEFHEVFPNGDVAVSGYNNQLRHTITKDESVVDHQEDVTIQTYANNTSDWDQFYGKNFQVVDVEYSTSQTAGSGASLDYLGYMRWTTTNSGEGEFGAGSTEGTTGRFRRAHTSAIPSSFDGNKYSLKFDMAGHTLRDWDDRIITGIRIEIVQITDTSGPATIVTNIDNIKISANTTG